MKTAQQRPMSLQDEFVVGCSSCEYSFFGFFMRYVHVVPQADSVLKPSLAMHLACGHLTGIVKEDKDLVPKLTIECYEVCQMFILLYMPCQCRTNVIIWCFGALQALQGCLVCNCLTLAIQRSTSVLCCSSAGLPSWTGVRVLKLERYLEGCMTSGQRQSYG